MTHAEVPAAPGCRPDPALREGVASLAAAAGYGPDEPYVVAVQPASGPPVVVAGRAADGRPLDGRSVVYTASLSKQVVAACAALLVQQGRLDPATPLRTWVPELPGWAGPVRIRHLLSHTSGLPDGMGWDELVRSGGDHTTAVLLASLLAEDGLLSEPGTEHRYSNAGYVCLGLVLARVAGRPLPELAHDLVLAPTGMTRSRFWEGPDPSPPGAVPLHPPHPAPLSLGDGGLWSCAADLLRWNRALDRDSLGVTTTLQTPGRLDDGTVLDYAWGLGVREHAGRAVYRHGGSWAGLNAQLVRIPELDTSFVVIALDDDEDRTGRLTTALLDELVG